MKYVVTVEITVEAESEAEAEAGMNGAMDNLVGDDFKSYEVVNVVENTK